VCYCIDQEAGLRRRPEVFAALEYEPPVPVRARPAEETLPPPVTQSTPTPAPAPVLAVPLPMPEYPEYSPENSTLEESVAPSEPAARTYAHDDDDDDEYEEEDGEGSQLLPGSDLF
jgi:hypothetical protein